MDKQTVVYLISGILLIKKKKKKEMTNWFVHIMDKSQEPYAE